ncbi:MAG TPA: chemotaxis protein CheW [Candidatus Eisenbacteria bacterium]|nr:chemotaxis protein CheW [Candidatus Eisenbacteria bacterium]
MADERLLCTFRVADHLLGLDIAVVQEVLRRQEITRLPLSSPAVRGIINLRGHIVPAVDLRCCLDLPAAERGEDRATIVVRGREDAAASLLVDEIGDVVQVADSSRERAPETVNGIARQLIHGVFPLHDRLLLELELGEVLRVAYA